MKNMLSRVAALALSAVAIAGCSIDQPTAVAPRLDASGTTPSAVLASTGGMLTSSLVSMKGLQRAVALQAPVSVSKIIGIDGGTLSIPQAGVTVTVPRGALAAPTTITMTARAGVLVAYDFAPHGITFANPLTLTQSLSGTNASLVNAPLAQLGYYSDPSALTPTGVMASEQRGGVVNTLSWTFTSTISHFSGYVVTCGREGPRLLPGW